MARLKQLDYSTTPECDVVVRYINKRYKTGLNTNIYVIGLSGTGKSSTSQRLSEKIIEDRGEDNEVRIVDSFLGLLKAVINSKSGDIIIIEEVSVLFPSKRAMAEENVNVGKVLDTCRKRNLCIISNAPLWPSIDSHMRAMGHLLIETLKIVIKYQIVISKFHRLQTNPLTGKTYRHTMQRSGRDINRLFTKKPNQEKWDKYERDKDKFMDELYKTMEFKQKKKKEKLDKEMGITRPSMRSLTEKELRVHQLVNVKSMKVAEVAKETGVTERRIYSVLKNIQKKADLHRKSTNMTLQNPIKEPIK